MNKLIIKDLKKTYDNGVKALDGISLEINSGMFGLLGPNGAGKSSLMRTLASLQEADSGSIFLGDIDIMRDSLTLRKHLGYLPQEFGVYPRTTAEELLDHIAILKGITNKKERRELVGYLLNKVNLYEKKDKYVKGFSGGMKQRVGIAQALIGDPKLIIVDEPTAGLDPGERNRFHNLLSSVSDEVIVILSTHIVEDVRELCLNMAIMNQGKIVYKGAPQAAVDELQGKIYAKQISLKEVEEYQATYNVLSNKMVGGTPVIHILHNEDPQHGFEAIDAGLEDVFFAKLKNSNTTISNH